MVFASLIFSWNVTQEPPLFELEKWIKLFSVALMAKYSILLSELTRTEGSQRLPAFIGRLAEEATCKKVISIFFLSKGQVAG